jgi:hypothetical protein
MILLLLTTNLIAFVGRAPRKVVEDYLENMHENDSENLVGLLSNAINVVMHNDEKGTKTIAGDEVEEKIWKKSSGGQRLQNGKNYVDTQEEVTSGQNDDEVVVKGRVKKGKGWADATTVFHVGLDGLIDSIETWLTEGKKTSYKNGAGDKVSIPPQEYIPA